MAPLAAIPVYYDPRMVADAQSFSPSASKPIAVMESWSRLGLPLERCPVTPVTVEELCLAHDRAMVEDILSGRRENGFDNTLESVARSLPFTSGAMLGAARKAVENGRVAVAPVSGFHHAGPDHCGGYCTFNGLIVAARVLLESGAVGKVGILDFDQHYGDGTTDCILKFGLDRQVRHFSAGRHYRSPDQSEMFLGRIPTIVGEMQDCGVVLYQAGADPHLDDPLGGWLSSEQLAHRDHAVFECAQALGLPVAWNLAGGYQDPIENVLAIHDETMRACARIYLAL